MVFSYTTGFIFLVGVSNIVDHMDNYANSMLLNLIYSTFTGYNDAYTCKKLWALERYTKVCDILFDSILPFPSFSMPYSILAVRFFYLMNTDCFRLLQFMSVPSSMHQPLDFPWYAGPTVQSDPLVLFIQNYIALIFVVQMVLISGTFIHRTVSIASRTPFTNRVWTISSFLTIFLQFIFMAISIRNDYSYIYYLPWWIHIVCFLGVFINIPIQELVKADDRKKWILFQKRTKLEFNTKLGMHSPL